MPDREPLYTRTMWQPWAWAMATGIKPWENARTRPSRHLLGKLVAIHAGKHYDRTCFPELRPLLPSTTPGAKESALGAIIGIGRIARVVHLAEQARLFSDECSPWLIGPVGILYEEVVEIQPVPCPGAQGWWRLPDDVAAKVWLGYEWEKRRAGRG